MCLIRVVLVLRMLLVRILDVIGILKFEVVIKILLFVFLVYNLYFLGFRVIVFKVVEKIIDFNRVFKVRF